MLTICSVIGFSTLSPYYLASTMFYDEAIASSSFLSHSLLSFFEGSRTEKSNARRRNYTSTSSSSSQQDWQLPDYHVVFSTSCSDQQNWESYVFFYHARRVRQRGTVTRIASGCSDQEAAELQAFHDQFIAPMAVVPNSQQSFHLHLTPNYSRVRLAHGKDPYKYMNKPYGMRHWMENALGLSLELNSTDADNINSKQQSAEQHRRLLDGIVILMDPDMILLRPIGHDFSDDFELWVDGRPSITMVTHGHPIAQQDGYLGNEWMNLDYSYITQDKSVQRPDWKSGPRHWNTGPPYLATVRDMFRIVTLWTETAPRTLDVYPKLFAEMYGFIWATVMLNLPFTLTKSIVVSTTETNDREGWSMVDALDDSEICTVPVSATSYNLANDVASVIPELPTLPVGLHYCKRYTLGEVGVTLAGVR